MNTKPEPTFEEKEKKKHTHKTIRINKPNDKSAWPQCASAIRCVLRVRKQII